MGFTTSNLSLYHTFSKTPVDSNTNSAAAQLGNAINKSGHTVQSNEIWTESIPFFGLAATTTAIHDKFSATAKVNDLVKDSDGKIWQRNSTLPQFDASGALTSTFADLWSEKTKSITSFTKGTDGKYIFTEADGPLVDGSYLLNSEGVPTVKYYEKRILTRLTAENNANTNSDNKASRLRIDGKWIDQFIGATDIYLNGSAAVSYIPGIRKTADSPLMQSGPGKGYMDYCATGLILWESSAAGTEVIDCFEYVGTKLDATVAKLSAAVFGSGSTGDEDLSLSEQVTKNTIDLNLLENKVNAYHEAGVSYKVYNKTVTTDADLPDLTDKDTLEEYKNVILLVPTATHPDGSNDFDNAEAMSGGYIEYLCVKTGEATYAWEKIGTTEADLTGYARFIYNHQDPNTSGYNPRSSAVYASIGSNGYLSLGAVSATSDLMGVSMLFSGNYWELSSVVESTSTSVSTNTASEMFSNINEKLALKADANNAVNSINGIKGAVNLCVHNFIDYNTNNEGTSQSPSNVKVTNHANLWGMGCYSTPSDNDNIVIFDTFVGASGSYLTTASLPTNAVSVENNFIYNNKGEVITTIRPERMVNGFNATPAVSGLKSFVGDLSNLESSAAKGDIVGTFYNMSALTTFIGDLSSLKNGEGMFSGCLSLTTFIGDLSSLEKGSIALRTDASGMFCGTALTVESVENIAEALPENPVVDITNVNNIKGSISISWNSLTSDTTERQKLVDALCGVLDKGWVLVTNSELRAMFDKEKYQVVEETVQPLDLESEPQEIAYVIKK